MLLQMGDISNEVLRYCTDIQNRAIWLSDYCDKLCEGTILLSVCLTSVFEPMTPPDDMFQMEKNDISYLYNTDASNTAIHAYNRNRCFRTKDTNASSSPAPITSDFDSKHRCSGIGYTIHKNEYGSKPIPTVHSSAPIHNTDRTDSNNKYTNEVNNERKKTFRVRCMGERADSNCARMSRPVKRKMALVEDSANKRSAYGV